LKVKHWEFTNLTHIKHNATYKSRKKDLSELHGEYDPKTLKGRKRLLELAHFESSIMPKDVQSVSVMGAYPRAADMIDRIAH
jgi:hypothetical protein